MELRFVRFYNNLTALNCIERKQTDVRINTNKLSEAQWLREELRSADIEGDIYVDIFTKLKLGSDPIKEHLIIRAFRDLYARFNAVASEGAKTIIGEHLEKVPYPQRRCKPLDGRLGAVRFHYKNIFFKLALDNEGLYGSDEFAMKVPLHERKSYTAIDQTAESLWNPWSHDASRKYIRKQGNLVTKNSFLFFCKRFQLSVSTNSMF